MIAIRKFGTLFWKNPLADHQVAVVAVEISGFTGWHLGHLEEATRTILEDRYPALRREIAPSTLGGILATMSLSHQQEIGFNLPDAAGADDDRIWFATEDPYFARVLVSGLSELVNFLIANAQVPDSIVTDALDEVANKCEKATLDRSTRALVAAATARGIPWFRLSPDTDDVQLGHGHKQARIRRTLRSNESAIARGFSGDKAAVCRLLAGVGLPVGTFRRVGREEGAVKAAERIGFPVVLKPNRSGRASGPVVGLTSREEVQTAAEDMLASSQHLLVQSFIDGDDHRLLVVAGRVVAVTRRDPASVTGDGQRTVAELIRVTNGDRRRGLRTAWPMALIEVDAELDRRLADQGLTRASVPAAGTVVRLRATANIHSGGTAVDVTGVVHPDNLRLAVRAARTLGLKVADVNFITPDITRSWHEVGGGISDLNGNSVGLRPHLLANPDRDVVGALVETLFPAGDDGRVPTVLIGGSRNGAMTARILEEILREAGHVAGTATSGGVTIDDETISSDDVADSGGAALVLREPTTTAAVLEMSADDIARRGLYVDRCSVAALLGDDDGTASQAAAEAPKNGRTPLQMLINAAVGPIVFNADDERCLDHARGLPVDRAILFARDPAAAALEVHRAAGGTVVTVARRDGREVATIMRPDGDDPIFAVTNPPALADGPDGDVVSGTLAAIGLAHGMGVPVETIAAGLARLGPSPG